MTTPSQGGPPVALVPVDGLHEAPWNPRQIDEDRLARLTFALQADPDFLWLRPVLANGDGEVYAGNHRLRAAQGLGWTHVPAIVADVAEDVARARALRDNAQWAEWEDDGLAALLEAVRLDGIDLSTIGLDDHLIADLLGSLSDGDGGHEGLTDPDDIPDLPEEPVTQPGDVWSLGPHRVVCGDATDPSVLRLAVGDRVTRCAWTDPPYGVTYVGRTTDRLTMAGDDMEGLRLLLTRAFAAMDETLAPGAAIYVSHPSGANSVTFGQCFIDQGWRLHQTLVWVKDTMVLGHSDYHYRHEPILFGYKPVDAGRRGRGAEGWYGDNSQTSVFEIPRPSRSDTHPTSKPVDLVDAMLRNSTRTGDLVLDPFLGSGSTLMACEQLGLRCAGVDIDPRYVDVAVRRWEAYTGIEAERGGAS